MPFGIRRPQNENKASRHRINLIHETHGHLHPHPWSQSQYISLFCLLDKLFNSTLLLLFFPPRPFPPLDGAPLVPPRIPFTCLSPIFPFPPGFKTSFLTPSPQIPNLLSLQTRLCQLLLRAQSLINTLKKKKGLLSSDPSSTNLTKQSSRSSLVHPVQVPAQKQTNT